MTKSTLYALIILALTIVVIIFNTGQMKVDLVLFEVRTARALVLFCFTSVGVLSGLLLK